MVNSSDSDRAGGALGSGELRPDPSRYADGFSASVFDPDRNAPAAIFPLSQFDTVFLSYGDGRPILLANHHCNRRAHADSASDT